MKRTNILKLITIIAVVALIIGASQLSYAANTITPIEKSGGNGTNNTVNTVSNTESNTESNSTNNTSNNTSNNKSNNTSNNVTNNNSTIPVNNSTALPEAGAESSIGLFVLIGLTAVSAVYTYIKVKEYNI